ncbi:Sulfite reductase-related protein [Methanosarcina siciliae C2J]|uniref:Sulfite reductase-related protein n=1 Tax=Methanosarcina siciliae C2J TaxID=1434118 RepID=A0A0E3PQZ6_9EURY|nr:4Fe-4S binding protein [Methanosarcina siciliae]AKB37040.1 Sulfite reductase-related protein [Methanosarcina siciliae C2J]
MAEKKIDLSSLKSKGFLSQRQENMFSMRLKVVSGNLDAEKLRAIADTAEKYGSGYVHITSRQQIEVPFVKLEDAETANSELEKQGISGGSAGKKVRAVVACQGDRVCRNGLINCQDLAYRIDEKYFGEAVPKKFKVAVTGCPAACVRPQENDFGVMGAVKPEILEENCVGCKLCEKACKVGAITVQDDKARIDPEKCILCGACIATCRKDALREEKPGYTIFVGGNGGRHPRQGRKLLELANEEQLFSILEKTFEYYRKEGLDGERFGNLLDRLGFEKYLNVIGCVSHDENLL